ncbi:hypothetical protein ACFYVC_32230 [Streptomyces tendae]|uniref:hypothetical protein n=1 Tax=Streptomyces tendae TaxID=1932 RepID=UPI00368EBBDF
MPKLPKSVTHRLPLGYWGDHLPQPSVEKRPDETRMRVRIPKPDYGHKKGWIIRHASATGLTFPDWDDEERCYRVPKMHLAQFINAAVEEWGDCSVRLAFNTQERCTPACKHGTGAACTCSCLGANHGAARNGGEGVYAAWERVSDVTDETAGLRIVTFRVSDPFNDVVRGAA